jgi:hypothetical protein
MKCQAKTTKKYSFGGEQRKPCKNPPKWRIVSWALDLDVVVCSLHCAKYKNDRRFEIHEYLDPATNLVNTE